MDLDLGKLDVPKEAGAKTCPATGAKETVGLATHDLAVHVDGSEPNEQPGPKKGKKKKVATKKKASPSKSLKSSKSKQLPDARL